MRSVKSTLKPNESALSIMDKRTVRAMGSVMEFWPAHSYAKYMPKGTLQQRIGNHWKATGDYLRGAISSYEKKEKR